MPTPKPWHIDQIWAFISSDEDGEGVCAFMEDSGIWLPMVAADKDRIDSLMRYAKELARVGGKQIKLVKFSTREEIQVVEP